MEPGPCVPPRGYICGSTCTASGSLASTTVTQPVLLAPLDHQTRLCDSVHPASPSKVREQGVRILNYLIDWLILAPSRDQLCEYRDLVPRHLRQLGLWVNWEKSKLSPLQSQTWWSQAFFSRYGVGFGQTDGKLHRGTCSVSVELLEFVQRQDSGPTETVSEALGAYSSCSSSHATRAAFI